MRESSTALQARTTLAYEGVVDAARHEVAARVDAASKAEQAAAKRMKGITRERDDLRVEADRKEATLKSFSQVCVCGLGPRIVCAAPNGIWGQRPCPQYATSTRSGCPCQGLR